MEVLEAGEAPGSRSVSTGSPGDILLAGDLDRGEAEGKELDLLVHDAGVDNQVDGLVAKDRDEWLVVQGQGKVWEAEEEVPALVDSPASC